MERFSIDESGYTGFDLLNPDQRFQGAAAISITDEAAFEVIHEHFPKLRAAELKYGGLARRPANRERLLNLQRHVLSECKCVTYICNKKYLLLLMFLDYAVEPFYYRRGLNFYEDGQNYGLASLLYHIGPSLFGSAEFSALLAAFQRAINEKSSSAISNLVKVVRHMRWQELPEALGPLAHASPECLAAIATPGLTTDAAMVVLQSLISRMEVMAKGTYRVEHDASKNLIKYHELLQRLIDHDVPVEFKETQITAVKFPLKLAEVIQVDSKESPAVQIADVLIGSAVEVANSMVGCRVSRIDTNALRSIYAEEQFIHLTPSLNFKEQKEFRRGSQAAELIDYFAKHFH